MFKCEICGKTSAPRTPSFKVVVETRPTRYPTRSKAHQFWTIEHGHSKFRIKDDHGGFGHEIVREVTACRECRDRWLAERAHVTARTATPRDLRKSA